MTGTGIAVYTDEQISSDLALALRWRGYDALSCREARRVVQGISDHVDNREGAWYSEVGPGSVVI